VKRNLDKIDGVIEIRSDEQHGTTVQLRIPITLAIVPVLMVHAGDLRFAIPQVHLEELITLSEHDDKHVGIERISGAEVFRLRGELIPVLRLSEVLELPASEKTGQDVNIVVVSYGTLRFGIVVDAIGDTEEIVEKPLSHQVKQLACYDGATIMGNGDVALILNLGGLFATANMSLDGVEKAESMREEQLEQETGTVSGEQRQTIVLFQAGKGEYYGVPLAFVLRLEDLYTAQIERSGGREVLQYRGNVLPLMRLESYLNIEPEPDAELMSMIVFSVEKQIGLVVKEILNTMEISTQIDTETFNQKGILGSTVIEGHSVMILDIHGLIEMAYPAWYKRFFVSTLTEEERRQTRILLVEDSPFFLNIEKSYLQSAGYQVLTAEHGKQALEMLETLSVDAVVTDIDMPFCNGFELTQAIRANDYWKHLPVMAVTSLSADEDRKRGIQAGVDEYKVKLDREDVLKALEQLIIKKRKDVKNG
jgi:two-component system chemotaxis sensor kinase CheA